MARSRPDKNTPTATEAIGIVKSWGDERPLLFSVCLTSALMLLVVFGIATHFFVPSYQTNDDTGMHTVLRGLEKVDSPDEHLRYTNVIVGFALKGLYTVARGIPWYPLFHYFVNWLAAAAVLYVLISKGFTWTRVLFFLLYFISVVLYFLNYIQFTMTSIIAGASGVVLFLGQIDRREDRRTWTLIGLSILCIVLSCLVRRKGLYLVILVSLPVMIILFVDRMRDARHRKTILREYALFLLVSGILCVSAIGFNRWYYNSDPDWDNFYRINTLKGQFIDFDRVDYTPETKAVFDSVGWSENDFAMLKGWFYADLDVFSPAKMETVLANFPFIEPNRPLSTLADELPLVFRNTLILWFLVVLFAMFVPRRKRLNLLIIGVNTVWVVLLMCYMILYLKLPLRVYYPMVSFIVLIGLLWTDRAISRPRKAIGIISTVWLVLVCLAVYVFLRDIYVVADYKRIRNANLRRTMIEINPSPDKLFVTWGAIFPHEYVLPFDSMRYLNDFKIIGVSTTLHTPFTHRRMEEFGIDDLYLGLVENPNVYLVASERRLPFYATYMREHYGLNVRYAEVYKNYYFGFTIYKPAIDGDGQ